MSLNTLLSGLRAAALAAVLMCSTSVAAFSPPNALDSLGDREREVLDAIAARDANLRDAALLATLYPDTLVHIELIQARSSAGFELRVKQLDREHQEELWELVRAEGALREIVEGGPKSDAQLESIAEQYPERIRAIFGHLGSEHFETLQEAQAIRAAADVEFENELASLPDVPRDAFRELLTDPGLLSMLGRSPTAVSRIGAAFDEDPDATLARLDDLALEVAENNARSEEDWQESFGGDPDAQADLERAARSYADEYGYDYDELTERDVEIRVHVHQHAYPYWFGYPHWYASWDPWGIWYPVRPHFGFYYGHGGHHSPVFFGLPSLHFVSWFYGGHYAHYPHLSRHIDYHHSSHLRAYRPLHRHARLRDQHRGHRDRGWSPARLSPSAVHAVHRRVETRDRDRGIERRDVRRSHMAQRRDTRRENGIERRTVRREIGVERRDARRQKMGDRRDQRRERAAERKSERAERSSHRAKQRKAAPRERRSQRDTSAEPRVASRSTNREAIHSRIDTRRAARSSRVQQQKQKASARSEQRRASALERSSRRDQARASRHSPARSAGAQGRGMERRKSLSVARAPSSPRVQQHSRPSRERGERASASDNSRPSRERAVRAKSRSAKRERAASSGSSRAKRQHSSGNRASRHAGRGGRR